MHPKKSNHSGTNAIIWCQSFLEFCMFWPNGKGHLLSVARNSWWRRLNACDDKSLSHLFGIRRVVENQLTSLYSVVVMLALSTSFTRFLMMQAALFFQGSVHQFRKQQQSWGLYGLLKAPAGKGLTLAQRPKCQNIICASWRGGGGEGGVRWEPSGGWREEAIETSIHVHMMEHLFNWKEKTLRGANGMLNGSAPGLADAISSDCKHVNVAPAFTPVAQLSSASSVHAGWALQVPHVFPHSPSGELRYISARSYLQVQNPALPWPFIFGCNPGMITAMVFKKYKLSHDIKVVSPLAWEIIQKAPSITGQLDGNYILNQCCLHQQRSWRNSLNYREAIFTGSSSLKITLLPISKHLLISQRLSVFTIPL